MRVDFENFYFTGFETFWIRLPRSEILFSHFPTMCRFCDKYGQCSHWRHNALLGYALRVSKKEVSYTELVQQGQDTQYEKGKHGYQLRRRGFIDSI